MRKPSYTVPIAIGVIGVCGLVGMNVIALRNAPKTEAQLEAEAAEQAKSATPAPSDGATPIPTVGATDDLVMNDGTMEYGPKDGTKSIVVGFEWTPAVQADPGKIEEIVGLLKRAAPSAKITLVNVDEKPDVATGIQVDGKVVAPIGPDGMVSSASIPAVMQAVSEQKKKK